MWLAGAVLGLGSVATKDLAAWRIHIGNPAVPTVERRIRSDPKSPDRGDTRET